MNIIKKFIKYFSNKKLNIQECTIGKWTKAELVNGKLICKGEINENKKYIK